MGRLNKVQLDNVASGLKRSVTLEQDIVTLPDQCWETLHSGFSAACKHLRSRPLETINLVNKTVKMPDMTQRNPLKDV